jgi:hypothetical protein
VRAEPSLLELCRAEQKSRKYFFQNSDMTIAEKVTQSANSTLFTLYKEGLFYKCYNEDAMLFVHLLNNKREIILRPNSIDQVNAWVDWFLVQGNK